MNENSAGIAEEVESAGVVFVDVGATWWKSAGVAGTVSNCRTVLNGKVLRWPLWENTVSLSVMLMSVAGPSQPFRLPRCKQGDAVQVVVFQVLEVVFAA